MEQEIYALSLAHFVVRALMLEAAKQENQDADRLSLRAVSRSCKRGLPECQSSTPAELEQWYRLLLEEMAQERTEPRRNRINPRVVKCKIVEVRQETSRASRPTDAYENLFSVSGYHLTNGIVLSRTRNMNSCRSWPVKRSRSRSGITLRDRDRQSSLTIHVCFLHETQFVRTNNANMEEAGILEKISCSGFCYPALNQVEILLDGRDPGVSDPHRTGP